MTASARVVRGAVAWSRHTGFNSPRARHDTRAKVLPFDMLIHQIVSRPQDRHGRSVAIAALVVSAVCVSRQVQAQAIDAPQPSRFAQTAVPAGATMLAVGTVVGFGALFATGIAFANVNCPPYAGASCWPNGVQYVFVTASVVGFAAALTGAGLLIAGLVVRSREHRSASTSVWHRVAFDAVPTPAGAVFTGALTF